MKGYEEFINIFGEVTILQVAEVIIVIVFCVAIYSKVRKHLISQHEKEKARDDQLKEALESVRKCPAYRQQTIENQKNFEQQLSELRTSQEAIIAEISAMKEETKKRERNKIRDRLLHNYRYYTSLEKNPSQSWTRMEAEAFWELFRDYEDAGGNGYMHTTVQPEMNRLTILD